MRRIRFNRLFQILYPLLVYFVIYQLGVGLLIDSMGDRVGKLTCLLIAAIVTIIPMVIIYRTVPKLIPAPITEKKQLLEYGIYLIAVVFVGIATNIILTQSGIVDASAGFEKASSTLTDGSLLIKILCNAIAVPILEELLIRGIITGQLCLWYRPIISVALSSIFFGILHNNIVQFIYALVVGIALGAMYVKTKRLSLCMLAHGLINLIVIL